MERFLSGHSIALYHMDIAALAYTFLPLVPRGQQQKRLERQIIRVDGVVTNVTMSCIKQQFGEVDWEGVAAVSAILSGQPFQSTGGKFMGATKGTSIISSFLSKVFSQELPFAVPRITNAGLTFTKVAGRAVGRWVPILGWIVLAYDGSSELANFGECVQGKVESFIQQYGAEVVP